MNQPDLFDGFESLPSPNAELAALARRLPANVRFGTSTWTYDGWYGDVYHRSYRGPQPAKRLEEYVRYPLFRTVGIDSAFYEPPSEEVLSSYAQALPLGFPCVSKVWDQITVKRLDQGRGKPNPDFLFEFQAMRGKDLPDPLAWADQLDAFLVELPTGFRYAVELRNPELFTGLHGEVLKRHRVAHVFNSWTEMPTIGEQLKHTWAFPADFTVVRALLKPGRRYADAVKAFEPYDRIQEPQPELRRDLLEIIREVLRRRIEAFILANNRAEGNAPGTIREVARMWAEQEGMALPRDNV